MYKGSYFGRKDWIVGRTGVSDGFKWLASLNASSTSSRVNISALFNTSDAVFWYDPVIYQNHEVL